MRTKKWITAGLFFALAAASISFHLWLTRLLRFVQANSDEIKILASVIPIVLWVGAGIVFFLRIWRSKRETQAPSAGTVVGQTAVGGVDITGGQASPRGDIVGRDRIVQEALAPVAPALHQLPSPPRDFTGREKEIRELMLAVERGGTTILGLQGMGGVGKSALALKLAEDLTPRYPDAQFYLDLKGVSKEPLTPKAAMEHVIRAYHTDVKLPESDAELAGLYRSVLHNQRALLLLDNARDARQVEPLIPPSSCMLIITSRFQFTVPGLVGKNLDALSPANARDLLIRIAPRLAQEPDDIASDLARLCGYLPLALRSAASTLAARIDLNPRGYLQKLKDAQEHLELTPVDAPLQLSYNLLTAELQKRFRALAVFPDSFDAAGAAAVWEAESKTAEEALGELLVYSLLEFNPASARYRLHHLVRAFAGARLDGAERMLAQRRQAGHYKDILAATDGLYLQGGESLKKGLTLFDLEWGNIQAGQAWATAHASEDKTAAQLCSQYPGAGAYCLELRLHPREHIVWLEAGLAAARHLKDRGAESLHLGNLGIAYASLGEYRRAIEYHEQRLQIAREIGDRRGEGSALGNLGFAYDSLGEYRRAIEYQEQRLQIAREIGDRRGEGSALGSLGVVYASLGEYRRAIEYQEQCLHIARQIGDRRGEGQALGNLGNAYDSLGDYRRAMEYQEQRLQIAREIGDRRGEERGLGNMGTIYYSRGEYRRAIDYYEQQLGIAREIGDRSGEGNGLWNMGLVFYQLGDRAEAIANASVALKILEQIESPDVDRVRKQLAEWRGKA
jgi:tetratricopeptide (TPR) repeat protein